jgi:hypothetical protein
MNVCVTAEDRKKVADWIDGGLTVSEIHQRLEAECGLHLTRLEARLLVADLEQSAEEGASPITSASATEAVKEGVPVIENSTWRWKPDPKVDYVEKRMRESCFERNLAGRIPVLIRWLLFVPTGLGAGVLIILIILLAFMIVPDEDVRSFGGISAGMLAGFSSVYIGMAVAPRNARKVAIVMGGACVVLTVSVFAWAWRFQNFENRLCFFIAGGTYCCSAVINAIVWVSDDFPGRGSEHINILMIQTHRNLGFRNCSVPGGRLASSVDLCACGPHDSLLFAFIGQ